jgi:ATP-dependent DNA helicase RecG
LAIDKEILEANHREFRQQLASLRLFDLQHQKPTNAAILLFGLEPKYFFAGAYIQYIKVNSLEKELNKVVSEKMFLGNLYTVLKEIDNFIKYNIVITRPVRLENSFKDKMVSNYPYMALRELTLNAIMHKDYQANTPIYIYEFLDRIEIHNAGFLYGQVTKDNFPNTNDYRNPILAEAMKNMGYVNRFNFGIKDAQKRLFENGNAPAEFDLSFTTKFVVTIKKLEFSE